MRITRQCRRYLRLLLLACVAFGLFGFMTNLMADDEYVADGPDIPHEPHAPVLQSSGDIDWEDADAYAKDKLRSGAGEQGKAVAVPQGKEKESDDLYRQNGFNAFISDMIALDRSVADIRAPGCKALRYPARLPKVDVILPFHNEHWTTLLRSCYSIIARSPKELLNGIIIVDDGSTKLFLKDKLDRYIAENLPLVKLVHSDKREGLIRARQIGAKHATADVIVFLDSHSEPNYNWLPPLISPIAKNYKTVTCPFVDVIDCDTFEYRAQDEGARGSFDWEFNYKRLPLPKNRTNPTEPFESPVMAGGYFAISRRWFWELGGYDEGLDIWGGEQYELSFKLWQCGGRMIDIPCSRVGHIYRCKYMPFAGPGPDVGNFIARNYRRVAEVWMDEYKDHLIKRRPDMGTIDTRDLTKQMEVRERLQCKPFKWFMERVAYDQNKYYPAIEPKDGANGEVQNMASAGTLCLDAHGKGENGEIVLATCRSQGNANSEQGFRNSFWYDMRLQSRTMCIDASQSYSKAPVVLFPCHGMKGNQHFTYQPNNNGRLLHSNGKCLEGDITTKKVYLDTCNTETAGQHWQFEHIDEPRLKEMVEQLAKEEK